MPGSRIQSPASLLLIALLAVPPALASDTDPAVWLQRMSAAVQTTNYEGTVLRIQDGKVEALKVVHTVSDGVIREKVVAQDGNGLEIIRNGNEVHCILPDRKTVLVEEWDDKSTLFSTLPSSEIRFGAEYDVSYVREDRVAGRKTIMIAIRPHDEYRYGHRIWLDMETGFPLQTQLIAGDGNAIEQVKFAEITLDAESMPAHSHRRTLPTVFSGLTARHGTRAAVSRPTGRAIICHEAFRQFPCTRNRCPATTSS